MLIFILFFNSVANIDTKEKSKKPKMSQMFSIKDFKYYYKRSILGLAVSIFLMFAP